jgi:endonuclease/exonuclease/phosphatase family metal-dependent hydrolase
MKRLVNQAPKNTEDLSKTIGLGHSSERPAGAYKKLFRPAAIGLSAIAAMGAGAWKYLDKSGGYEHFAPTVHKTIPIDNVERIISWNMEGHAAKRYKQIRTLAARYSADIIALQEVDTADANKLHRDLPAWHIVYALADQKQHLAQGGYGNMLLTRQAPTDIKTRSFDGTSLVDSAIGTLKGITADVASMDTSFTAAKDGWQERRVALAETTKILSGDQLVDIRAIDIHISGNSSVHDRQLSQSMDFIKDNIESGRPTVACGDFNAQPAEVTSAFVNMKMVTPTKVGINNYYNGDYCGYYMAGDKTTLAHVAVLNDFKTDHYPLEFSWEFQGPGNG